MSDRGVFITASLTAVLIAAGAFVHPQFFYFELVKSVIYIAIAVLVFFGEDQYSYMLGIVTPPLWFLVDIMGGIFFRDFRTLLDYFTRSGVAPLDTPLNALGRLAGILLVITSVRAWRREVPERFPGKTFWACLAVSVVYLVVVTGLYLRTLSVAS
jgi:hypothetical protein